MTATQGSSVGEKEGRVFYYGYKKHVATDLNGLVISVHTTPANISDIT